MEYVEQRIKEALKLAGGNRVKARQQIIAWTFEDAKLLQALAKPHLTGIVAYNIERVLSGRAGKKSAPPPKKPKMQDEDFGTEILKAVAGNSGAPFGLEGFPGPSKRGQASQQHIDAIRKMAAKSKSTKK